jgi:putative ABC transport system ATP-binding protein
MILSLKDVNKSYRQGKRKVEVLSQLNFEVDRAQSVAILGKSGSGKSTFLSLVAGLDRADSGNIILDNSDIVLMSEEELTNFRAQKIGIIFQQFHLMSTLSALENVMLPLEILKVSDPISRAKEVLKKVGLEHRMQHFSNELSGGECQRVAIARALVTRPKLLLADEPSGNLDSDTGEFVMNLLFDLVKDFQTTLLLVTHDKELAQKCDLVYTLKNQGLHANN